MVGLYLVTLKAEFLVRYIQTEIRILHCLVPNIRFFEIRPGHNLVRPTGILCVFLGLVHQIKEKNVWFNKKCRLTEYCKIFVDLQVQMFVFGTFHVLILIFVKTSNLSTLK